MEPKLNSPLAYWVANSRAVRAIPTDPTAIIAGDVKGSHRLFKTLPFSSQEIFLRNPHILKTTEVVLEPSGPSYQSLAGTIPSNLEGTIRLMIPLCFL